MRSTRRWEVSWRAPCLACDVRTRHLSVHCPRGSSCSLVCTVRTAPAIVGYGTALGALLGAFAFTGGRLSGIQRDPKVDEVSRKERLRKNRRRPVDGTIHELGEGRGEFRSPSAGSHTECSLLIDDSRHLRARVCREESAAIKRGLWDRCDQPAPKCGITLAAMIFDWGLRVLKASVASQEYQQRQH